MKNTWYVIANPMAGKRKQNKIRKEIKTELNNHAISFTYKITEYPKHEVELVQKAITLGYRKFIVVGGDGTLHNIVNGIMKQHTTCSKNIVVGVISIGTGNDWAKTYNIPTNIKKAITIIKDNNTIQQSIGYINVNGSNTYFNNVAGIGYDGYVVQKLSKLKKLGPIAYLLSGIIGMFTYRKTKYKIKINDKELHVKALMILFGIGRYSGGGMQLTDYRMKNKKGLQVSIFKDINMIDLITNLKNLYTGKILKHKKIETFQTEYIEIIPDKRNNSSLIEADGELLGTGNFSVSLTEKTIQFIVSL